MNKKIFLIILLATSSLVFSQKKKKGKLDTEEISVIKPYTPTVSDAIKIKVGPEIDSMELAKKELNYTINSVPVISTFTPAKGKAKSIKRDPKERIYSNYISAGYGNYNTPILEAFISTNSSNYNEFGGFINYHSSGGGIDGIQLNDNFLDFDADLFYKQTERTFKWQADAGFNHLLTNWYGLPSEIDFSQAVLNSIKEKQTYSNVYLGGEIEIFDSLFHGAKANFSSLFDNEKSRETRGSISGMFDFPVGREMIYTEVSFDFLGGFFDNDFSQTSDISYTFFNVGISPNFEILRENLTVNAGARLYYSFTNSSDQNSKFFAYPNITASFKIKSDNLVAYAGVVGDLEQNSYEGFVENNPFVSPTLDIKRTSQQYNGYLGIKGFLSSKFRFNAKIAYGNELDKPLYKLNPSITDGTNIVQKGYEAGNSFQIVYDDIATIHASGEIIVDIFKTFKFGGNIEFNSYSLTIEEEAWNLPMLKATLIGRYTGKKWNAGANMFFVSERKDELTILPLLSTNNITNGTYFDINLDANYNINEKVSVFVNFNNLLNSNYEQYSNFKVQGFQFLGGVKYKFNFK